MGSPRSQTTWPSFVSSQTTSTFSLFTFHFSLKLALLLLALLGLLASCANVKTNALLTKGRVEQQNFMEKVPFEYQNGQIFVRARLNGSAKEYRFLVNTGAPTLLHPDVVRELNIATETNRGVKDGTGREELLAFVRLDRVQMGNVSFRDIGATVADFNTSQAAKCQYADLAGFIGMNLLRQSALQIDYAARTLIFTDQPARMELSGAGEAPLTMQGLFPAAELKVGKKRIGRYRIDTGYSGGVSGKTAQLDALAKQTDVKRVKGGGELVAGLYGMESDDFQMAALNMFQLGNASAGPARMMASERLPEVVGNELLENYTLSFVWTRKKAYLKPIGTRPAQWKGEDFGLRLGYDARNMQLYVAQLLEGSAASEAGVRLGSRVMRFNGQATERVSPEEFCQIRQWLLQAGPEAKMAISFLIGTDEKQAELSKKPLF